MNEETQMDLIFPNHFALLPHVMRHVPAGVGGEETASDLHLAAKLGAVPVLNSSIQYESFVFSRSACETRGLLCQEAF